MSRAPSLLFFFCAPLQLLPMLTDTCATLPIASRFRICANFVELCGTCLIGAEGLHHSFLAASTFEFAGASASAVATIELIHLASVFTSLDHRRKARQPNRLLHWCYLKVRFGVADVTSTTPAGAQGQPQSPTLRYVVQVILVAGVVRHSGKITSVRNLAHNRGPRVFACRVRVIQYERRARSEAWSDPKLVMCFAADHPRESPGCWDRHGCVPGSDRLLAVSQNARARWQ